jgi:hypothetical protein
MCSHQNRFAEAQQLFVKALDIDPALHQCRENLRRLREAMPSLKP